MSKVLFSEAKSVFSTLLFQYSTQSWWPTEEHSHFAFLVLIQLLEYLHYWDIWHNYSNAVMILTLSQSGLPACVLVLRPVMRSLLFFLCIKSNAICSPIALMSFLPTADVMYMCSSRNRSKLSCSLCSASNWLSNVTNHSNDFWCRLIQKKSTYTQKFDLIIFIKL